MDILQEVGEQILHLLWAFGPLAILAVPKTRWWSILTGALAGFILAAPRELIDQLPIERPWDTVLDLTFFIIGGALAGLTAWLVRRNKK
jgi:hypothetical protein